MKGGEFKDTMFEGLAKLLKALANTYRLEIIEMLSQGEKNVEVLYMSPILLSPMLRNIYRFLRIVI